ncbi:LysR substrate-binding domain-containing protein [Rhizobium tubonense]|uniref:LysR substrate-binding domain-containing protein n=1 Tax=Rhizobium tubonense TaxID=484088 RepID=UPI0018A86FC8|nr:LysR substrate-binding domain-containing protein [Rhizobium tubonense]
MPKRAIVEALIVGDIDVAITLSPITTPTVLGQLLTKVNVVAGMRKDDPLAECDVVRPEDLDARRLISYGSRAEVGANLDDALAAARRKRDLAIQIASSVGAAPLVREGLGIALVDGLVAWHGFKGLAARVIPEVDMQLAVSINNARPESRFLQLFLAALRAAI